MSVEIRVPPLGESVVEATVGKWTKQTGAPVEKDEVLVELETDKITVEVAAPRAGVLGSIAKNEGDTVGVNDLLGSIEEGAGVAAEDTSSADGDAPATEPAAQAPAALTAQSAEEGREGGQTSPAARAIAAEHGIDLASISGSGPNGRVTKEDVLRAVDRKLAEPAKQAPAAAAPAATSAPRAPAAQPARPSAPAPAPAPASARSEEGRETRERMSRRRQTIARRLVEAQQTTASLTTFNEVDMSRVFALRKRRQEAFVKQHGIKLGFMSFFAKAAVGALRRHPRLNAEIQGDEIVLKNYFDIGVAVGTDEGLVVPVVRDVDRKSFATIEREIGELAGKARDGKLALSDLQGGTFTITNGGIYGSMLSTPILNPPQVGILGMHNIVERAVVVNGQIEVRPMMYLAHTYDHRIVDGSEAVRFLVAIKEMIEDPETMLLEG
jgi:2-oxoglutarate dehydrogenase E2 component (dihydrolipoamide succinyltransferase)